MAKNGRGEARNAAAAHWDEQELRALVQSDRVHRSYYLDPDIFEIEMERVFGATWVYVGHASQVPEPGDFLCTDVGRQPVVMCRHEDSQVYVLFNRCGHRGAKVVNEESGTAKLFRCCYHGWTYHTDGELAGVPLAEGYGDSIDLSAPELGMVRLPRVADYHGFVFASLSPEGPDLVSYLGGVKSGIDEFIDRAPDGEIEVVGGCHRYEFHGNWKFQLENVIDSYHPYAAHECTLDTTGRQMKRHGGVETGPRLVTESGAGMRNYDEIDNWSFAYGHGIAGPFSVEKEPTGSVHEKYRALLVAKHGDARTTDILRPTRHNTIYYPNLIIQSSSQHLRVVRPVAVDRTELRVYPIRLKGAPEEMHHDVIRYLNITHAPGAMIQPDDLEAFGRMQQGLVAQGNEWVLFARGLGQEIIEETGWRAPGTNEMPLRNQQRAWLDYMCGAAQDGHGAGSGGARSGARATS